MVKRRHRSHESEHESLLVYTRLWELQQQPPATRYDRIEKQIQKLWNES